MNLKILTSHALNWAEFVEDETLKKEILFSDSQTIKNTPKWSYVKIDENKVNEILIHLVKEIKEIFHPLKKNSLIYIHTEIHKQSRK